MAGRGPFPDFFRNDYNKMKDDFHNPELNSYDTGPGSYLQNNMPKDGVNTKLYVTNIPSRLTEDGLMHIFSCEGETPENVYIHRKNCVSNTYWGFVTFKTIAAASNAMVAIHKKPPYNFYVHFARTNDDDKGDVNKDRLSIEEKPSFDKSPREKKNIPSSRGRGKLPPMKGLPPSSFKAIPTNNEPYIDDLEEDYTPGRFSHCGISFEQNISNSVFSPFAEGEYDDGKRKMTMGRGSYVATSKKKQPVEGTSEELQDMEQRISAYLGNKAKNFMFDKDAFISSDTKLSLPMKPGNCSYCSRPAIYVCSKCKCWYCTNYCRKMDWNVHKNVCVQRLLQFQDGLPVYKTVSGTSCSEDMSKRSSDQKQSTENYKGKGRRTSKGEGSDHDRSGHDFDKGSISDESLKNYASDKSPNHEKFNKTRGNKSGRGKQRGKNRNTPQRSYKNVETDVCIKGPPPIHNGSIASKLQDNKKSFKDEPPIAKNIFTKVTIGAVGQNSVFYAYKNDDYTKQANIMTKLGEYCHSRNTPCAEVKVGTKCIAPFDGDWFRAEIVDVLNDFVKVLFIDFGNESLVKRKDLKMLPEDLAKEPPMAYKFLLANSSSNPPLTMDMTLAIKPVSQDMHGGWVVQVEGVKYSANFEKFEDGTTVCSVAGNDSLTDRHVKHFLSLLQNNDSATLVIEKIMNDEFLTGAIIVGGQISVHEEISRIIGEEVVPDSDIKLVPGMMLAAKWKNNWYRGYLMIVRDQKPVVALIDKGIVAIPDHVAELPKKVINIPECGVRVIFEKPILNKNMAGETVCIKHVCHDLENNHVHAEIDDFGKVIILAWEPALEEAGLDCIKVSSGSKVQISAYHSPSAIYVQSCDSIQKTIRSEILQDVASYTKGQPLKRKPLIGEYLACRYIEDGYYYRAQVFQKEGDKYKVNFVDYGNTELVSQADMKQLPDHLKRVPCCAVKVGLKNVPNLPFNTQCMKFLNELAANSIEMFITYEKDLREVTLELREGDIVNKVLFSLLEPSWNKPDFNPLRTHIYMASEIKYESWNKGSKFEVVVASVIRHDTVLALRPASGLLNHVEQTLIPRITEYCESKINETYNPRRSELCLAKFHEDGKWYRALCLKSYQHNAAEVFYFDYGNSGEILHRCIRKMVPEFMEAPAVLKCCQISGLPEKVSDSQSSKLKEYLSTIRTEAVVLEDVGDGDCVLRIPAVESYASQLGIPIKHPKSH
ncbi:tudor domain-containing protein 1 isoform X3 [Halyomorpha halys]|uniref:tudor domain-containing protein 1 isoform X3 n=1 Tax=Halyomorpha halys TaxID=286706 RepID=UPI0034D1DFE9